ncbi:MAG: glycosyltransferase involved in cell wall biosynthesis [Crocinitomix sp.]|jgi:glycosyltransferase involved in cell wall biosynthesis
MQRHKVIHVLYSGLGGHANVVFSLFDTNFRQLHDHVLVFFGVEETLPNYIEKCKELGIKTYSIHKKPRKYLKAFASFKKILQTEKPDRIIVHSSELIVPAVRYRKTTDGIKIFYVEHENNQSKGQSLKLLSKYALRKANAVVCLNENYKAELQDRYKCKVPLVVIANGIDTEKYKPTFNKNEVPFKIGMASRMIPGKDHKSLLNAFKNVSSQYPNIELHIAGDGETLDETKALSKSLNLDSKVHFLGLLNEVGMLGFYAQMGAYVLATNAETLSTALLQAMSCELPIITSDIANNRVLIEAGRTGWLYEVKNSLDLEQKIIHLLANPAESKKFGTEARKHVMEHFSIENSATSYNELIQ